MLPFILFLVLLLGILGDDFDGQIGATQFAHLAGDALFGANGYGLILVVQFKNLFGAKGHAYSATLAPLTIDLMLLELLFCHFGFFIPLGS